MAESDDGLPIPTGNAMVAMQETKIRQKEKDNRIPTAAPDDDRERRYFTANLRLDRAPGRAVKRSVERNKAIILP
ncbi:MAG: hypothetical protein IKC03_01830 [Oscillospiraceae bacterium]|nr:hypothetical protein [Oscillospiraceae bacterium]